MGHCDAAPWSVAICVLPPPSACITEESLIFWLTFFGQKNVFYYQQIDWTQVGKLQLWSSAAALGISNKVFAKKVSPHPTIGPWVHGSSEMIGRLGEGPASVFKTFHRHSLSVDGLCFCP